MSQESTAASQANAAQAKPSDVKTTNTAANVSGADAIARFAKAERERSTAKPAETEAAPETTTAPESTAVEVKPDATSSETTAADTANADLTEAVSTTDESEAPAEAIAEAEASTKSGEEGEPDVLSPHSSLDPKLKEKIQKRINKEVAKRGALEREVQDLKAKLESQSAAKTTAEEKPAEAQSQTATPPPAGTGPLAEYTDVSKLRALEQDAVAAADQVQDLLDSPKAWKTYTIPDPDNTDQTVEVTAAKIGDKFYTREQLVEIRRKAVATQREVPQRLSFLKARDEATKAAHATFPYLADKNSPEYQIAQQARREPWLAGLPNAEWIIGVQIEGIKAIEAKKAAAATAAKKPADAKSAAVKLPTKPAGDQTAVSTSGPVERVSSDAKSKQRLAAEEEKMRGKKGVSGNDVAAFLALKDSLTSR